MGSRGDDRDESEDATTKPRTNRRRYDHFKRRQARADEGLRAWPSWATRRQVKSVRQPISRVLSSALRRMDDHSSGTSVAGRLTRPTRTATRKRVTCHPYLVLLPVGLAVPFLLPGPRCALTAPFQPHLRAPERAADRRYIFCGAIPRVAPGGCYPSPCFRGARTFLPAPHFAFARSHEAKRPSSHLTRGDYKVMRRQRPVNQTSRSAKMISSARFSRTKAATPPASWRPRSGCVRRGSRAPAHPCRFRCCRSATRSWSTHICGRN